MNEREHQTIKPLLGECKNPVIVELGAYRGEEGPIFESMIQPGESLLHIMVEPDPINAEIIRQSLKQPSRITDRVLIEAAIAHECGPHFFKFSHNEADDGRYSGSLRRPTGHLKRYPDIKFPEVGTVDCFSLDFIFSDQELSKIDLLWVDVQGAEREVILGGKHAIARTHYCMMEAETVELYAGEALRDELIRLLAGWELIGEFKQWKTTTNILLENKRFWTN